MNRKFLIGAFAAALLAVAPASRAADILDRVVATVNGHIILQSDWQDALHFESLVDNRSLDQLSTSDWKAALDRLIDQELLREQTHTSDFPSASDDGIAKRIQEIRGQYPEATSQAGWRSVLERYRLTENEVKRLAARQLEVMSLVDARLRPNVAIDSKSIESFYNQELLPQLRQSGAKSVALTEVSPKIKELLTQRKVNELLVTWLQTLRSGSDIRMETASPNSRGSMQ
jgi:peptidyl-prolyl cis-trans isomerase SurA